MGIDAAEMPMDLHGSHYGLMRVIPPKPSEEAREKLKMLVGQSEGWHLRGAWAAWLGGERFSMTPIEDLTPDQRIAAMAWLRQQRHALHRVLHDVRGRAPHRAPDGWIEDQPIYRALAAIPIPKGPRGDTPANPSFSR